MAGRGGRDYDFVLVHRHFRPLNGVGPPFLSLLPRLRSHHGGEPDPSHHKTARSRPDSSPRCGALLRQDRAGTLDSRRDESGHRSIRGLAPHADLDALEVSGDRLAQSGWSSYRSVHFPEFDLSAPLSETEVADIVICEQVLEHVVDPITATRNLFGLLHFQADTSLSIRRFLSESTGFPATTGDSPQTGCGFS